MIKIQNGCHFSYFGQNQMKTGHSGSPNNAVMMGKKVKVYKLKRVIMAVLCNNDNFNLTITIDFMTIENIY